MTAPLSRRRRVLASTLAAGLMATVTGLSAPTVARADTAYTTIGCPAAETLASRATWHRHTLARGVLLSEARVSDPRGIVEMHVLTVDLTQTNLSFAPLVHHLAQRLKLSYLASGHSHLVAATNTGYFDFPTGAPLGPVVNGGVPMTASSVKNSVMGIGTDRRVHAGNVWLTGTVSAGGVTKSLQGLNVLNIPYGLTVFTPRWGGTPIQLPWNATDRYVSSGVLSTGVGRWTTVPTSGALIVARGSTATAWLKSLGRGASFGIRLTQRSDAPVAFRLGLDVGGALVTTRGVVKYGLPCRKAYPQPARTAIGYRNYGKTLMIVVVTDHYGTSPRVHGLDATQMSKLMVELGAWKSYLLDGSGSSEMIARMPSTGRLSIRNWPADGQERLMPVGLGIFTR